MAEAEGAGEAGVYEEKSLAALVSIAPFLEDAQWQEDIFDRALGDKRRKIRETLLKTLPDLQGNPWQDKIVAFGLRLSETDPNAQKAINMILSRLGRNQPELAVRLMRHGYEHWEIPQRKLLPSKIQSLADPALRQEMKALADGDPAEEVRGAMAKIEAKQAELKAKKAAKEAANGSA